MFSFSQIFEAWFREFPKHGDFMPFNRFVLFAVAVGLVVWVLLVGKLPQLELAGKPPSLHGHAGIRRIDGMRVKWASAVGG